MTLKPLGTIIWYAILSSALFIFYVGCAGSAFKEAKELNTIEAYDEYLQKYGETEYAIQARKIRENIRFNEAKDSKSVSGFDKYLNEYPEGTFASEAKKARENIRFQEAINLKSVSGIDEYLIEYPNGTFVSEAKKARENFRFQEAKNLKSVSGFDRYLNEYPNGTFVSEVSELKEIAVYNIAKKYNTISDYDTYLDNYPKGAYVLEVKKLREKAAFLSAMKSDSLWAYDAYLDEYPNGDFASDAKRFRDEKKNEMRNLQEELRLIKEAKLEEQFIAHVITTKGVGSRLVIPGFKAENGPRCAITINDAGGGSWALEMEMPSDRIPQNNYGSFIYGHGSIHRFSGEVSYPNDKLPVFYGEGRKGERLTFVLLKEIGYVYVRGKGKVVFPDGRTVELGK